MLPKKKKRNISKTIEDLLENLQHKALESLCSHVILQWKLKCFFFFYSARIRAEIIKNSITKSTCIYRSSWSWNWDKKKRKKKTTTGLGRPRGNVGDLSMF